MLPRAGAPGPHSRERRRRSRDRDRLQGNRSLEWAGRAQAPLSSVSGGAAWPWASASVVVGLAGIGPAAAGLDGAAVQCPSPSWRTRRGVRRAARQAVHSCTVASATQRSLSRRCSRTGSLSGALQAQQRWPAARRYASAVCASRARDAPTSGGARRAPSGAVTRISGSILTGLVHCAPTSTRSAPRTNRHGPVWRAARPLGKGHSAGSRAAQGAGRAVPRCSSRGL